MLEEDWTRLVLEAWRDFDRFRERDGVVQPSMPILYFGNLGAYLASPIRVLSLGLNPSLEEFPAEDAFQRFPEGAALAAVPPGDRDAEFARRYLATLGEYFHVAPCDTWFNSLRPVLRGMGVSLAGSLTRVALHTDLFSTIATNPPWGRLRGATKRDLRERGVALWRKLFDALQPTFLVVSFARDYLESLPLGLLTPWTEICRFTHKRSGEPRRRPYVAERAVAECEPPTRILYGPAAQTPFGLISNDQRFEVGRRMLDDLYGC